MIISDEQDYKLVHCKVRALPISLMFGSSPYAIQEHKNLKFIFMKLKSGYCFVQSLI
jgi:hypothetical protein